MEITNKRTILIALAIAVVLAIGTGIVIKNSVDAKQNNPITVDIVNANNSTTITAMSQVTNQNITPTTTAPVNNPKNSQTMNNSSPVVTITVLPNATVSPTATISPSSTISLTATATPSESPLYPTSKYEYLQGDGMYTVTVYITNSESEGIQLGNEFREYCVPKNFSSASNVTALILYRSGSGRIYQPVDIPGNPLTSSNNIIYGEPAYTFSNVPSGTSGIPSVWIEYNGKVYRDMAMFGSGHVCGFNIFPDKGDIMPSGVTSDTIYGYVHSNTDATLVGVNVSLYSCVPGDSAGLYINTGLVNVSGNPQLSGNTGDNGLFRFDGLQPGLYNVTAEKDGLTGYYIVDLKKDWNGLAADPSDGKYIWVNIS